MNHTIKYVILLVLISVGTHLEFFNFGNILFYSDWTHWSNGAVKDLLNFGYGAWTNYSGFGGENIQYFFNIFKIIWGIIGDYEIATKLTFFIPIAILGFLSPFFLIRYFTKNNLVAFIIALFYGFNTYFLVRQTAHLPIAFIFSIFPILILYFDRFLHNPNQKDILIFSFLYTLSICYEIRIMYICTIILLIYFCFFGLQNLKSQKFWKYISIFLLLQIGLNSFWILPTIFSGGEAISNVANRGLFGNHLFNLLYSLVGMDQSWTGGLPDQNFVAQRIPIYFWFYPTLIVLSALFIRKYNPQSKKLIYFGLLLSVLGILLTKQSAEPLTWLYQWLYDNFPGFNLFREASKFFILIAVGYSIILSVFFEFLYNNSRRIFYIFGVASLCISGVIATPLITKEIGTIFIPKVEPQEYKILNQYIQNQDDSFKTLWIPQVSQWGDFNIKKPRLALKSVFDDTFKEFNTILPEERNNKDYSSFIMNGLSSTLLNISGVKYIIIPLLDPKDDFFRFYGSTPDMYYQKLKAMGVGTEVHIDGLNNIKVFENKDYLSTIFLSSKIIQKDSISNISYKNIDYNQKNPSHYTMNLSLGDFERNINFSQEEHVKWDFIIGDFYWYDYFIKDNFVLNEKVKTLAFLNSWSLKKDEFVQEINSIYGKQLQEKGYPKLLPNGKMDFKYYQENPDGTIDFHVTLFFRPQAYFYLGLIISGLTLFGCITYLIGSTIRRKKKVQAN